MPLLFHECAFLLRHADVCCCHTMLPSHNNDAVASLALLLLLLMPPLIADFSLIIFAIASLFD